jgi:hypothetical protein
MSNSKIFNNNKRRYKPIGVIYLHYFLFVLPECLTFKHLDTLHNRSHDMFLLNKDLLFHSYYEY